MRAPSCPALRPLLGAEVQGFLIDAMSYDPTALAAQVARPMLVIQGTRDLQVSVADARILADAAPDATLALLPDVNHVLKNVTSEDPSANLATYADPNIPIAPSVVDAVTDFVERDQGGIGPFAAPGEARGNRVRDLSANRLLHAHDRGLSSVMQIDDRHIRVRQIGQRTIRINALDCVGVRRRGRTFALSTRQSRL